MMFLVIGWLGFQVSATSCRNIFLSNSNISEILYVFLNPKKADIDESGTLNCEEFVTMAVHLKRMGSDEHLSQAFHYFDKNRNGFIEIEELQEALLHDDLVPNNGQLIDL